MVPSCISDVCNYIDGLTQRPGSLFTANMEGVERVLNESYAYNEVNCWCERKIIIRKLMILYCTVICIVLKKKNSFLEFVVEEDYLGRGTCRLSIARHEFFKVNFAFALPNGSRMKPILDKKWYAQQPIQPSNNNTYYLYIIIIRDWSVVYTI